MNDLLLYLCVGVWAVLTVACIIALAWLLDDRKMAREGRAIWDAECKAREDWFRDPLADHPHIRTNRDRTVV